MVEHTKAEMAAKRWRPHLRAWRESGLSQARYCKENGLSAVSFSCWKRKLETAPAADFVEVATPLMVAPRQAALLELRLSESFDLSFSLRLPGEILGRLFGGDVSRR